MSEKEDAMVKKWTDLGLLDLDQWGIRCDDGWTDLIDKCLQELYDYKVAHMEKLKVQCIKEKFGGLRVYCNAYNDEIGAIEGKYCELASHTCEVCGIVADDVKVGGKMWLKCMCPKCKEEINNRFKRFEE